MNNSVCHDQHDGIRWQVPDWPAPAHVRACTTQRNGGFSCGRYSSLNLATHVGDDPITVMQNRSRLRRVLALPAEPLWLEQVHGADVTEVSSPHSIVQADAAWTQQRAVVCAVLSADCLPLLLCDRNGTRVAAVHAGWRGMLAGVIGAACNAMQLPGRQLLAWLGPAIGPAAFEVGDDVREAFVAYDAAAADAFRSGSVGRCYADLYRLARQQLARSGITAVYGGDYCTWAQPQKFFSYRRDGVTGRMATLIWLDQDSAGGGAANVP